ncbi:MAG TPA: transposase [Steroidobacteraceae bacterium]
MTIPILPCIRTLRLKVRPEGCAWLNAAAIEINQVWNFSNETSFKAARPFSGPSKWLSAYDLDKLTAGSAQDFDHIGSGTIQRVNAEFAAKRNQAGKPKLRWRVSKGSRRSLGWVPFKAEQLKLKGQYIRFSGKAFRVFELQKLSGTRWKCGCFAQDAVGDWWLCMPVEYAIAQVPAPKAAVGIDLGLKRTAVTSDGVKLEAGHSYRGIEQKIAQAQRRGHKHQAKRLHRKAARRRQDALHKFSSQIVKEYQTIVIGDVSSHKLARTRMAKSVLDAGWGMLKTQLQYKGQQAGRCVQIVNERNTTRACSSCRALTGPTGLDMLVVRTWTCTECGVTHDRDVNAARNILSAGRSPPSVSGNESTLFAAPPNQTSYRCQVRISAQKVAA